MEETFTQAELEQAWMDIYRTSSTFGRVIEQVRKNRAFDAQKPEDKAELMRQESAAYHKWSVLQTEAEQAHAEYVRVSDRLNAVKVAE